MSYAKCKVKAAASHEWSAGCVGHNFVVECLTVTCSLLCEPSVMHHVLEMEILQQRTPITCKAFSDYGAACHSFSIVFVYAYVILAAHA
jgi:hypothetical protein